MNLMKGKRFQYTNKYRDTTKLELKRTEMNKRKGMKRTRKHMMDKELYPSHKKLMKGKILETIRYFRRTY